MENYLHEAFQAFKALDEDVFPATADGEEALKKFLDGDNLEDVEVIIDPDAETEDELKQSYVGDVIFKCPVCQSMVYKKPEDVVIDENQGLANVEEECPYCQTAGGFEIVGQVSEYCPECEHHDEEAEDKPVEPEVKVDDEVELEESLGQDLTEYQKWVDYDMKRYGEISAKTEELLRKTGLEVVKDDHCAWAVMAKDKDGKDLKEAVDSVKVTTEDQEVVVDTDGDETEVKVRPRECGEVDAASEVIEPVDEETKDDLMADEEVEDFDDNYEDGYEDVEIEDFDEDSFDELEEKYLKNIYENVTSYKTIKGTVSGDKIILEGIITFNSGKQKKTTSIFESHSITKRGKIKLLGENKNITTNKKAFTITGSLKGNKLITESLTYNYGVKDETGKATRLYGTVRK